MTLHDSYCSSYCLLLNLHLRGTCAPGRALNSGGTWAGTQLRPDVLGLALASRRAALPRAFYRWPDWRLCWSWRPSSPFSVLEAWFKSSGSALAGLLVCLHRWPASSRYSTEFLAVAWPLCLRRVTVFWPLSSERWPCRPCGCKFTCRCFTLLVFSWLCLLLALVCAARRCFIQWIGFWRWLHRFGLGSTRRFSLEIAGGGPSVWRYRDCMAVSCRNIQASAGFRAGPWPAFAFLSSLSPFLVRLYPRVAKRSRTR